MMSNAPTGAGYSIVKSSGFPRDIAMLSSFAISKVGITRRQLVNLVARSERFIRD
jgi:hypothetical protein